MKYLLIVIFALKFSNFSFSQTEKDCNCVIELKLTNLPDSLNIKALEISFVYRKDGKMDSIIFNKPIPSKEQRLITSSYNRYYWQKVQCDKKCNLNTVKFDIRITEKIIYLKEDEVELK